MSRAAAIANKKVTELEHVSDSLRVLMDNPDDSGLTTEGEIHLRQALDNITLAMKSLEKIGEKS